MAYKSLKWAVAALATASLLLAGCTGGGAAPAGSPAPGGSGPADLSGTTINYWYWQDVTTDTTIQDLATKFKAETGITVNIMDNIAQPDFFDSLVNAVAAGNAPDATHLNTNMLGQMISANVLENLNDYIAGWDKASDITDTLWQYVENADGSVRYAVPNKFLMFYMYYRADLFQAAGVAVPKTQEEFVAASKAMAAYDKGNTFGFDIRGGANGQDQWAAFLVAGGAKFVDSTGTVAFDSPEARASNNLYISTFDSAPPGAINDGMPQIKANFIAGKAAMIINHLGSAKEISDALGDKAGVALIPSATGDPSKTSYMGTMNMNGVLASSTKKDAAFKWISYLAEADAQLAIAQSPNGYLPVVSSVASDPAFANNKYFQTSIEAAKNGTVAWPPVPGTTKATQQTWQPLFQGALLGKNGNDDVVTGVAQALAGQ